MQGRKGRQKISASSISQDEEGVSKPIVVLSSGYKVCIHLQNRHMSSCVLVGEVGYGFSLCVVSVMIN